jgi:hypothetical protein
VGGTYGTHEIGEKSAQGLSRKPEEKKPLGRPRLRREDGIRMDLGETDGAVPRGFSCFSIGTGGWLL